MKPGEILVATFDVSRARIRALGHNDAYDSCITSSAFGSPGAVVHRKPKATDLAAHRAKAYADMESHLGDVVRMGEIAAMMFDKDQALFVFAATHLDEMLQEFRRRYYAMDFPL